MGQPGTTVPVKFGVASTKLRQFATIESSSGPARLERKDKVTALTIESQIVGRAVGDVGTEIEAIIARSAIPEGMTISYGGDMESQTEAFGSLGTALMTSLLLVYLIMVALYDSWVQPFIVMFSIPVALIGAFLALALAMQNMSIFAIGGLTSSMMLTLIIVPVMYRVMDAIGERVDKFRNKNKQKTVPPHAELIG